MRIALVILIAVAQLAGHWLCSCGAARASTAIVRMSEGSPVAPASGCSHCPLCKKVPKSAAPAAPVPADSKSVPVPDQCPCSGVELVALPAKAPVDAADLSAVAAEPFGFTAFSAPVVSLAVASVPGLRELPNLTVHDRLFKHHVLRC